MPKEYEKLLAEARKSNEMYYYAFFICGNLGLRVSELICLKKEDFDFEHNLVRITTKKQKKKTEIKDAMEVPANFMKLVKPYVSMIKKPGDSLFDVTKRTIQYAFDKYMRKIGLKVESTGKSRGRGIHSLRHMRGIMIASKTRDPYSIAHALRHRSISTSMAYVHLTDYKDTIDKIGVIK